jgi:hypothetical protein
VDHDYNGSLCIWIWGNINRMVEDGNLYDRQKLWKVGRSKRDGGKGTARVEGAAVAIVAPINFGRYGKGKVGYAFACSDCACI